MTGEKTTSSAKAMSTSINSTQCLTEPKISMLILFIMEKLPEESLSPWNTKEHQWEETKDGEGSNNKVGVKTREDGVNLLKIKEVGDSHLKIKEDGEINLHKIRDGVINLHKIRDGAITKEDGEETTTVGESLIDFG